jgi:hypothetical protein
MKDVPKAEAEAAIEALFGLDAQRVLEIGSALAEIEPTPGFQALVGLLREEQKNAAFRSLTDDSRSRKEWRGYIHGIGYLLEQIPELIERARALKDMREETTQEFVGARLGSGSLAG